LLKGIEVRTLKLSSHALMQGIPALFSCLIAFCFIFFLAGFVFYTPPPKKPLYDSMTMRIERLPEEVSSLMAQKEQEGKQRENGHTISSKQLPRLKEKAGKVRVVTRYEGLLAQMGSILIGPIQIPDSTEDRLQGFMSTGGSDPLEEGIPTGFSLETIIRERMAMIEDVLEYASSQAGITIDLLAAVAWAESKMLPYAINVDGKEYYFTSRERALEALRRIRTGDVDIGLFQVNYRLWGEPLGLKKEDLLDSRVCAIIGAMILKYNLQRHKDPWEGIGRYHSGDEARIRAYQIKVSHGLMIIRTLPLTSRSHEGSGDVGISRANQRDPAPHDKGRVVS
jgi:hypothetical protein